jgi:hypothetical protein
MRVQAFRPPVELARNFRIASTRFFAPAEVAGEKTGVQSDLCLLLQTLALSAPKRKGLRVKKSSLSNSVQ